MQPGVWHIGPDARFADDGDPLLVESLAQVWPIRLRQTPNEPLDVAVLSLRPGIAREDFVLHHQGQPVCGVRSREELPPSLEKWIAAWLQAFTRSAAVLHAALLRDRGRLILLPAERRSGKSTFCLLRTGRGAEYGGDDLVLASLEQPVLHPVTKAITLKEGSFPFAQAKTWSDPVRGPIRYQHPARVLADSVPRADLKAIFLPRYAPSEQPDIRPLPPALTALSLVRQLFGGLDRDPRHLALVKDLSATPAFALTYPDADTLHAMADDLLESL